MEKEFIPYNLALELKELGFDEPCQLGWYLPHSEIAIKAGVEPNYWQLIPTHPLLNQIAAPTFSQCFRWFREKYNLSSWIYNSDVKKYWFTILQNGRIVKSHKELLTYEEAELACIVKLIEIVKQK